jgi:hypothetical protein
VQQARHAWAFSHAAATGALGADPEARRRGEAAAKSAGGFMTAHMHRDTQPGTWWVAPLGGTPRWARLRQRLQLAAGGSGRGGRPERRAAAVRRAPHARRSPRPPLCPP